MANNQESNTARTATDTPQDQQPARELVVQIDRKWGYATYKGTRAQLEAEGVIPANPKWPSGRTTVHWQAGKYSFELRRTRPDGLKGPMTLWTNGDWWHVQWMLTNGPSHKERAFKWKVEELADEWHRHSDIYRQIHAAQFRKYWAAREDTRFQAFKALIPGLIPPKRGRKKKSEQPAQ